MSCGFKILANNVTVNSTLSGTTVLDADLGIDNIKNAFRESVSRWDSASTITINGTFARAEIISLLGLFGLTTTVDVSASFTLYSDDNQTGDVVYTTTDLHVGGYPPLGEWVAGIDPIYWGYDPAIAGVELRQDIYGKDRMLHDIAEPVLAQSFAITITDTTNAAGFVDLRHLVIGHPYTFEYPYSYGSSVDFGENGLDESANGYTLPTGENTEAKKLRLPLDGLNNGDRAQLSLMYQRYKNNPWYVDSDWLTGIERESYRFVGRVSALNLSRQSSAFSNTELNILEV